MAANWPDATSAGGSTGPSGSSTAGSSTDVSGAQGRTQVTPCSRRSCARTASGTTAGRSSGGSGGSSTPRSSSAIGSGAPSLDADRTLAVFLPLLRSCMTTEAIEEPQECGGRLEREVFQHLGDQGGDRRALGAGEGHVREERVALQRLDHRRDAVVPADPQVVALGDVVSE